MDVQTTVREIRLTSFGRRELEGFLAAHGLGLDADTEYALGVYDEEENLVACGCAAGRVLKQFAVAECPEPQFQKAYAGARLTNRQVNDGASETLQGFQFIEASGQFRLNPVQVVSSQGLQRDGLALHPGICFKIVCIYFILRFHLSHVLLHLFIHVRNAGQERIHFRLSGRLRPLPLALQLRSIPFRNSDNGFRQSGSLGHIKFKFVF